MINGVWTLPEFKHESNLGAFHRRSNIHLRNIDKALKQFTAHYNQSNIVETNLLLSICIACKQYNEHKPTGHQGAAVMRLYYQAITRVRAIVKALDYDPRLRENRAETTTQSGWKRAVSAVKPITQPGAGHHGKLHFSLHQEYFMESLVAGHITLVRNCTENPLLIWQNLVKSHQTSMGFIDWVRDVYLVNLIDKGKWGDLQKKIGLGVAYLNKAERDDLKVYIKDGVFYNSRHERFHTGDMDTNFAGRGWGIFVMDLDNNLYVHSHKTNAFHHSSFLSGAPVQMAGEIAINNGVLVGITTKSGHYKPNVDGMLRVLFWCHHHGVELNNVAACPETIGNIQEFFNANEVLLNSGKKAGISVAKPLTIPPSVA